jgi:hypothetical protein
VRLTLVGLSCCNGSELDLGLAFRFIRYAARREIQATESQVIVSSAEAAKALRISRVQNAARYERVFVILGDERWGNVGLGRSPESWHFYIGREVWRFAKVTTVEEFQEAHRQWQNELAVPAPTSMLLPAQVEVDVIGDPEEGVMPYVDLGLIEKIAGAASPQWDCSKLRQLVAELNDNVARDNGLAAHALLRALLDHIPPLFGYPNFTQVVNNHSWTQAGKRYMKRLEEFRNQADDALHTQIKITRHAAVARVDDLPKRLAVEQLLSGCLDAVEATKPSP